VTTPNTKIPTNALRWQRGIGTFKAVAAIAGIGITLVLLFVFLGSPTPTPNKSAGTTGQDGQDGTGTNPTTPTSPPGSQPTAIRIPENYSVMAVKEYKLSFAYPTQWAGAITFNAPSDIPELKATPTFFNQYALGNSFLNGQLTVYIAKQDAFKIYVHSDDGAYVAPVKLGDSYGWKVVQSGMADPTLKVGDSYDIKSAKYQSGIPVYNFATSVKNTVQSRWIFQSGDYFIAVSLPLLSRPDGSAPSTADIAQYTIIANNIAKTLRPTN
jgi:hypothetical protein